MDEPSHGPRTIETDGVSAPCWEWPQAAGPSLVWLQPDDPEDLVPLARQCPGDVVVVEDVELSSRVADAGLPLVRHLYAMAADPADVVRHQVRDDLRLTPLTEVPLEQLAEVRIAAFAPGHPDHVAEEPEARVAAYARELADRQNPPHHASRAAWIGGEVVATCLVTDSRHFPGYVGPWVQSVARKPPPPVGGAGAALLVEAARAVLDEGGSYLGLAVTASNPARMLYERMGWSGPEMWLHHVPGGEG
jgi:hypothetical protein